MPRLFHCRSFADFSSFNAYRAKHLFHADILHLGLLDADGSIETAKHSAAKSLKNYNIYLVGLQETK